MNYSQRLQLVGPCALFAAIVAAEGAAYALAHAPTSEFLWYVNLRWFAAFQSSHYVIGDYVDIAYFQLLFVALPLLVVSCIGLWARRPLVLALASNVSFAYTAFLVYAWCRNEAPGQESASLVPTAVSTSPGIVVCMLLLGACLVSFLVSHVIYLRAVRAQA